MPENEGQTTGRALRYTAVTPVQRVLFISKPFAPPFHDGTKCLVRDIAQHLQEFEPVVMSTRSSEDARQVREWVGRPLTIERVYPQSGSFAPTLASNGRAALWLALRPRGDLWHFVFAPNRRASQVGRWLRRVRGARVLQTIASPPRHFESNILFGDIVVAQSSWTRARVEEAFDRERIPLAKRPRLEVIPPPVRRPTPRSSEAVLALRRSLEIAVDAPLIVYPGDIELGGGAKAMARAVASIARELPDAVVIFAYRDKTAAAPRAVAELRSTLDAQRVRFTNTLPDIFALLSGARVIAFPVDDLWGKVDLPIVLLESMALGVPVVAFDKGPLKDLHGARLVPDADPEAFVRAIVELCRDDAARERVISAQRATVDQNFDAPRVAASYEKLYRELEAAPLT